MITHSSDSSHRIVKKRIPLFTEMLRGILSDIRSLTPLFNCYRTQLTQAGVALITLIILVFFGIFITKSITEKRDRIAQTFPSGIENISDRHKKPEAQVSKQTKPTNIPDVKTKPDILQKPETSKTSNTLAQKTADVAITEKAIVSKKSSIIANHLSSANVKPPKLKEKQMQYKPKVEIAQSVVASPTQPGILKITVDDPADAQVYIDGSLLMQSEIVNGKRLTPGDYTVTANASGYKSYYRSVLVESDKTLILSLALKPDVKGNGQLHIYSYPWANLYVDGVLVGTTPTPSPIVLTEGDHNMVLKRDGYQEYNEKVTIRTGDVVRLKVELKK